jgi:hypothetical protein
MALEFTQPPTEMSARIHFLGDKAGRFLRLMYNPTNFMSPFS